MAGQEHGPSKTIVQGRSRVRLLVERYRDLYFPLKFVVVAVGLWLALRFMGGW